MDRFETPHATLSSEATVFPLSQSINEILPLSECPATTHRPLGSSSRHAAGNDAKGVEVRFAMSNNVIEGSGPRIAATSLLP